MKIIGLDVSKASVSCCLLTERPTEPRDFYYKCNFEHFSADITGIKSLLTMQPDIALIEPTGVNYSKIWVNHLTRIGVEVRFVGHKELRNYRMHQLGLPDKDDDADALALACYYFDYQNSPCRFLKIRDPLVSDIREKVLRLSHINRVRSPISNRARQDLAWQFPEVALIRSTVGRQGTVPLLWGWLAGQRDSDKYDKLYSNTIGLGITKTVRYHAERICSLYLEEIEIESELNQLLKHSSFTRYLKVFSKFNFGTRLQAWLISQTFPFETFLENNRPIVIERRGRFSGKSTKRHLSLRKFQKTLGVAPSMESSGDVHRQKVTDGSSLCRKALWQWVFTAIEPRSARPSNEVGQILGNYLDTQKSLKTPVQLARSRTAVKAVKLLFSELVREFCK